LNDEVEFITTPRDAELASFECAKDHHIFPWADANARFGFIKYSKKKEVSQDAQAVWQEELEQNGWLTIVVKVRT
jgi:hypothetical protein